MATLGLGAAGLLFASQCVFTSNFLNQSNPVTKVSFSQKFLVSLIPNWERVSTSESPSSKLPSSTIPKQNLLPSKEWLLTRTCKTLTLLSEVLFQFSSFQTQDQLACQPLSLLGLKLWRKSYGLNCKWSFKECHSTSTLIFII